MQNRLIFMLNKETGKNHYTVDVLKNVNLAFYKFTEDLITMNKFLVQLAC